MAVLTYVLIVIAIVIFVLLFVYFFQERFIFLPEKLSKNFQFNLKDGTHHDLMRFELYKKTIFELLK